MSMMIRKRKREKSSEGSEKPTKPHQKVSTPFVKTYLFPIDIEHTKFMLHGTYCPNEILELKKDEVVSVILKPKVQVHIYRYTKETLKRFLHNYLNDSQDSRMSIEEDTLKSKTLEENNKVVKQELNEIKISLIYLLRRKNLKPESIAQYFGINVRKVYSICQIVENRDFTNIAPPQQKRFIVSKEMLDELEKFLLRKKGAFSNLFQMREYLVKLFNLPNHHLSIATVANMVKKLKFSYKRVSKVSERKNLANNLIVREHVAADLLTFIKDGKKIIFMDECGFQRSMVPLYGYAKKGQRVLISANVRSQNFSVICAITKDIILAYQIFKGSVTANIFGGFIASLIKDLPDIANNPQNYILFLDNAKVHKAQEIQPFLDNFQLLFNAPYTPSLNPIEEFFGNWKRIFRKKIFNNTRNMYERILDSVIEIDSMLLYSSYIHSLQYLEDCLDRKPI